MSRAWWPAASGLPIVVGGLVLWLLSGADPWNVLAPATLAGALTDALLINGALAVIGSSLAGVILARGWSDHLPVLGRLSGLILAFGLTSAAMSFAFGAPAPGALGTVIATHTAMIAGALAFGSFGILCGRVFRHPLDAAAVSLGAACTCTLGILVAGPFAAHAPSRVIDGALLASPLVTIATAARIDILRTDVLYRISPLAHVGTDYVAWPVATAVHVVCTAIFVAATARLNRRNPSRSSSQTEGAVTS